MRYLKKFNEGQSPSYIIDSIEGILVDLMDNNMVEITDKSWSLEVSIKLPVDIVDSDNRRDFIYNEIDFESIKDKGLQFDMVFIDADHSHEQSYKDFLNVKDMVVPDGFVFFHDTYPCNEELTQAHFCNDCYKTPIAIKENFSDEWEVVTLPFNPGVTICKKARKDNKLPWMY
jgi:hypothetical protein